jgi:hypothetical protein
MDSFFFLKIVLEEKKDPKESMCNLLSGFFKAVPQALKSTDTLTDIFQTNALFF